MTRTVVRKLVMDPATKRISHAIAFDRTRPNEPVEIHAKQFIVAGCANATLTFCALALRSAADIAKG